MATPVHPNPHTPNLAALEGRAYVSAARLARALDVSETTIWRMAKAGRLPKPHKLGANTTRWAVADLPDALTKLVA